MACPECARNIGLLTAALALFVAPAGWSAVPAYGSTAELSASIDHYRTLVDRGGWQEVSPGPLLREGDSGDRVDAVVARLRATGDLAGAPDRYDRSVVEAVKRFQQRHGLKVDGLVGPDTRAALNVSATDRLRTLEVNLDRRRDFSLEGSAVLVNLPDFHLYRVKDGNTILDMKVAVGQEGWATPSMSDEIESVVINPYWFIPVEIVVAELAPKVVDNPDYLEENDMEVVAGDYRSDQRVDPDSIDWSAVTEDSFEYFVRQRPGPENPLGQVKILFPNDEDIYLHDTPEDQLFGEQRRGVSHGCIRLEKPFELAASLLGNWHEAEAALRAGETSRFYEVHPPVPVHLVYWTAWVDPNGTVHFREDVYRRDDPSTAVPVD